jgi:two-component system response regulator HydG
VTTPLSSFSILVVDDDRAGLESVRLVLEREGFRVLGAESGREALELLRAERVHLVLTDLMMPGMDGVDLMKAVRQVAPGTDVILMTAYGTIEKAVEAIQLGASDFLTKPLKRFMILRAVNKVAERQSLLVENQQLRKRLEELSRDREIIGNSSQMRQLLDLVRQVGPTSGRVLIQGESGTGKELVARALHVRSERRDKPFVAINLAAIPESLVEAELFGHEKGAFTGADRRKPGRFEQADGGTLFLDEVGEMPLHLQPKILRAIQEREFYRVGGTEPVRVDVRILACTNRRLEDEVKAGRFREDLFYRLNVITLVIPPLRDRRDDVPLLASAFVDKFNAVNHKSVQGITRDAMGLLSDYAWPGNVRELENVIERAVILCTSGMIDRADLPDTCTGGGGTDAWIRIRMGTPLDQVERLVIEETLKWTRGDKKLAAGVLNTSLRTIYRRLTEYDQSALGGEELPDLSDDLSDVALAKSEDLEEGPEGR